MTALSLASRLGPHEVLVPLGAGGMGEVQRARIPPWASVWDLRLDPRCDPLRDPPRFKKLVGEDWMAEASL